MPARSATAAFQHTPRQGFRYIGLAVVSIPPGDDKLESLLGTTVPSSRFPGVRYQLAAFLGAGSMAVAFRALRIAEAGQSEAVIKVMKPRFLRASSETALLSYQKEAVALGRLNEQVPPTPFVVRFFEAGSLFVEDGDKSVELPWLAVEYVHGGTLEERVEDSLGMTGRAFDPERAARVADALGNGLDAIHEGDVIHRDIKPNNILCCGSDTEEVFKIADFGVARPVGLSATFVDGSLGTPGYAAPEQVMMEGTLGPESDIFSMACSLFFVLTGEELFLGASPVDLVMLARKPERRSIRECRGLCGELRDQPIACAAIDSAIAHATAGDPKARPKKASILADTFNAVLRADTVRGSAPLTQRRPQPQLLPTVPTPAASFSWAVRHGLGDGRAIRSVAWEGDGTALVATTNGLSYWDGTSWYEAPLGDLNPRAVRFVQRVAAGKWLVGGDQGLLAFYSSKEAPQHLTAPSPNLSFHAASGKLEDLAVIVGSDGGNGTNLYGVAAGRWVKELPIDDASFVPALARFDDARWLVAGRSHSGQAFAAIYSPLRWDLRRIDAPAARVYLACSSIASTGIAMLVGAEGHALRIGDRGLSASVVPGSPDLSCAAMDASGRAFAASLGKVWMQLPQTTAWMCVWEDANWGVPFVSLYCDATRVIAIAADGGVIEAAAHTM